MKHTLILLMLLCGGMAHSQINISHLNKECFMVGTLSDYMGRWKALTPSDSSFYQVVDTYQQSEYSFAELVQDIYREEAPDMYMKRSAAAGVGKVYSQYLSKKIDKYYKYEASGLRTVYKDIIYIGSLKKRKIGTEKQKISFLCGVFLRFGSQFGDDAYYISISNSRSKATLCEKLLKGLGCENVEYKINRGYTPVSHTISFTPTKKLREAITEMGYFEVK